MTSRQGQWAAANHATEFAKSNYRTGKRHGANQDTQVYFNFMDGFGHTGKVDLGIQVV